MSDNKALIERDFPIKEVSNQSVEEKRVRQGHISTLHIWWARRPLASSRSTIFAALTPEPRNSEELAKCLGFVTELSKWENSLNKTLIEQAKKLILAANDGRPPRVLDCFAGGGAIPLECLRLGCETYAIDYNPVSALILTAALVYPQRYGVHTAPEVGLASTHTNPLIDCVNEYGQRILERARKEIGRFYPPDPDGKVPIAYIWARTTKCQNPSCGVEIPLMRQFWLANKANKRLALKIIPHRKTKNVEFKIAEGKKIDFDPSIGTTSRASVLCPACGGGMNADAIRKEAREGRMGQRLVAVVLHKPGQKGKTYRIATDDDLAAFSKAQEYLQKKVEDAYADVSPVPQEPLPLERREGFSGFRVLLYGMLKWGDLFNSRQKLALITFVEKVRGIYQDMVSDGIDPELAKSVLTYFALVIDKLADFSSTLCRWGNDDEGVTATFSRQALPIVWDYAESNPVGFITGSWGWGLKLLRGTLEHLCSVNSSPASVSQGTATAIPFADNYFDAVITDPPYYDNVAYADLSDFFYVWLKRTVGDLYPDLFATPLTPKSLEIIRDPARKKDSVFFEQNLEASFKEIHRILKPNGIAVIVFAHKSTQAWENIINGLLKSKLVLTSSWPIHTEMKERLVARETAALASSVYMVCRKTIKKEVGYFNDVRLQIDSLVKDRLDQFWRQQIRGADFFVSAIGPAIEVFGKYSKVEKLSGEEVSVNELLEYVRRVVSEFALSRILKRPDLGGVDATTRFYLLWRWTFNSAKVHFDDARKITQSVGGVELTEMWDRSGLVKKEKEFVRVLGPKDRSFVEKEKHRSMIDVLQHAVILWDNGDKKKLQELLNETGYVQNEIFWQVAQAISDVLPKGDKEKQLIQGFVYGRESYVKQSVASTTLLDYVKKE
jgi:adenine-specific DNA methylase